MKINKISVLNYKAISEQELNLAGCSAIITAGNNKGKTSILRGLIDRFRGEKADIILKDGEAKGFNFIELSDGSKIEWKFSEKTESFAYITSDGVRQTTGVLTAIGERYFGIKFDIDKFLNSPPKDQSKQLQKIVGLDFDDIDSRYKIAFESRSEANRELKRIAAQKVKKPEEVSKPNIESLKGSLAAINSTNKEALEAWEVDNKKHQESIISFNKEQTETRLKYNDALDASEKLKSLGFESKELTIFVKSLTPLRLKELTSLDKPKLLPTIEAENSIEKANSALRAFDLYGRDLKDYNDWVDLGKAVRKDQERCEKAVVSIEKERSDLISSAKFPDGFEINDSGILYNGFPLNNNQISSSAKYIAALKLGLMVIGEVRTMHFDASFLDKNSLDEVEKWAKDNDLQLLIERPDFDGGEIKYEFLNK